MKHDDNEFARLPWWRVDKTDGSLALTTYAIVKDRASACYAQGATEVLASGEVNTPFAIYVREDKVTPYRR